jgi:hypothetical protein
VLPKGNSFCAKLVSISNLFIAYVKSNLEMAREFYPYGFEQPVCNDNVVVTAAYRACSLS